MKKERIRARCSDETYKELKKAANKRGHTVSSLVRWIIDNWLRKNK